MNPIPVVCKLFESLATETWNRLMWGARLSCTLGETTITDLNLLELKRAQLQQLRVYKAHGLDESKKGFDWEWWIGGNHKGWYRYSVQAKKLDLAKVRYKSLRHEVGTGQHRQFQIDILRSFAQSNNSIPLYCFYNFVDDISLAKNCWNCRKKFDAPQLGCTIAPLHAVEPYHQKYKSKTFESIHKNGPVFPWRCLFCCCSQFGLLRKSHLLHPLEYEVLPRETLPDYLVGLKESDELTIALPEEEYASELGGFPKRIMIIDVEQFS